MLPVDAIIEVINEEVVGDDFPDLMEDHFLIYPGGVSYILLTCGKYQVLSQIQTTLQSVKSLHRRLPLTILHHCHLQNSLKDPPHLLLH